ncbi:Expansin B [Meloidogyne graminicola]|uniref:Expansin B n=1 Tax=Meloidogyne graminicola TaxID=189291 RepID=A0A8S9Z8U6_9BILA|nr:Expansin B [Meloidogyne graminicola]
MLVAISHTEWNSAAFPNPNNDPLCKNICLKVAYKGKSVKLRVKDKCPGCTKTHADLSKPAFEKLAPLSVGHVYGATLTFVKC